MTVNLLPPLGGCVSFNRDTILIGTDVSCDVIVSNDDDALHPQHARIRRIAGRWAVESVGEWDVQAGTQDPAKVCWLHPGELIRLTPDGPDLIFEPTSAQIAAALGPPTPPKASTLFTEENKSDSTAGKKVSAPDAKKGTGQPSGGGLPAARGGVPRPPPLPPPAPTGKNPAMQWILIGAGVLAVLLVCGWMAHHHHHSHSAELPFHARVLGQWSDATGRTADVQSDAIVLGGAGSHATRVPCQTDDDAKTLTWTLGDTSFKATLADDDRLVVSKSGAAEVFATLNRLHPSSAEGANPANANAPPAPSDKKWQ